MLANTLLTILHLGCFSFSLFFFVFSILCFVSFYYTFSCQAIHSHFFKKVAHLLATVAGACQISVPTSTGLTEVRVQVPFRTKPLEFFPPYCLSSAHDCEDHFHWNCFNLQIKSMSLMYSLYQECLWIQYYNSPLYLNPIIGKQDGSCLNCVNTFHLSLLVLLMKILPGCPHENFGHFVQLPLAPHSPR